MFGNYYIITVATLLYSLNLIKSTMLFFSKKTKEEDKYNIQIDIMHSIVVLLLLYTIYKLLKSCKNPDVSI
jgi:hypothetical protein